MPDLSVNFGSSKTGLSPGYRLYTAEGALSGSRVTSGFVEPDSTKLPGIYILQGITLTAGQAILFDSGEASPLYVADGWAIYNAGAANAGIATVEWALIAMGGSLGAFSTSGVVELKDTGAGLTSTGCYKIKASVLATSSTGSIVWETGTTPRSPAVETVQAGGDVEPGGPAILAGGSSGIAIGQGPSIGY